jgi:hypothetical protein
MIVNDPLFVRVTAGARPFDIAPDGRILAIKEDGSIRSDHTSSCRTGSTRCERATWTDGSNA